MLNYSRDKSEGTFYPTVVVGRGETSLLRSDAGSEFRLGREEEKEKLRRY